MLGRPFVLDEIGFGDGGQTLADHRDDEILGGDDADSLIGAPSLNDGAAVVDREDVAAVHRDGDGGAFTGAKATGGRQGAEESEFFGAGYGDLTGLQRQGRTPVVPVDGDTARTLRLRRGRSA